MSSNVVYSNKLPPYVCIDSSINQDNQNFDSINSFFSNNYINNYNSGINDNTNHALIEAAFSLTGLAQKTLQIAHNELALEIQEKKGLSAEVNHVLVRKIMIGAGFLGTIFLGIIEVVVRNVLTFLPIIIFSTLYMLDKERLGVFLLPPVLFIISSCEYTKYGIFQAAYSLSSHCNFAEKLINYETQANFHLFTNRAENSNENLKIGHLLLEMYDIRPSQIT